MPSKAKLSGKDYGGEGTRLTLVMPTVTAGNFTTVSANVDDLQTAINNVVTGVFNGKSLNAVDVPVGAKATDPDAQRERKWAVKLVDGTDPLGNWGFEIGMADATLLASDSENMNVASGAGLALVTAIESKCVSRLGNAITVESIKLIGRST